MINGLILIIIGILMAFFSAKWSVSVENQRKKTVSARLFPLAFSIVCLGGVITAAGIVVLAFALK